MSYVKCTAAHSTEMKSTQAMRCSEWVAVGERPECKIKKRERRLRRKTINLYKIFSLQNSLQNHCLPKSQILIGKTKDLC